MSSGTAPSVPRKRPRRERELSGATTRRDHQPDYAERREPFGRPTAFARESNILQLAFAAPCASH